MNPLRLIRSVASLAALGVVALASPAPFFSLPRDVVSAAHTRDEESTPTVTGALNPTPTPTRSDASPTPIPIPSPLGRPIPEPTVPHHYVVMIVVDANRTSYLSLARLPHLRALMQAGTVYDRAWVGELESSTPNVHVTLGTGTLPRENGFMGFDWVAPQTRKTIDFRDLLANHGIDPVLRALPIPSVATRLHQYFPHSVSVAGSGHKDYAVVGLGGGTADYELYGKFADGKLQPAFLHAPPPLSGSELKSLSQPANLPPGSEDSWAVKYALAVVRHVRPRLLMLNLPDLDTWGHWYGPRNKAAFRKLIQNVDRGVGQIEAAYKQLGIFKKTDFIITADHSMMDSRPARNWTDVDKAAAAVHASVARTDPEGGAVWLQNPNQAGAVAQRLTRMKPSHVEAILYRSSPSPPFSYTLASPQRWLVNTHVTSALRSLVGTTAGANGPDLWVLYRGNYTTVPRNVSGVWKGTHGGAGWKVQHIPLIVAGPNIRRGFHSLFPARAIDIAPTIERLLGLPSAHREGVVLADALTGASKAGGKAQKSIAPLLTREVTALQAQSSADDRIEPKWAPIRGPIFRCPTPRTGTPTASLCPTGTVQPTNQ